MWRKYPNPRCSHVISVDVVDRSVDPITGVIRTERILGCKQKTPTWIVKVSLSEFDHNLPRTYIFYLCKAIWRFWRRLCTRNFIRRPRKSKRYYNFGQPIAITVCHMFRADSIFSRYSRSDIVFANSGDTSSNGTVEVCCRWSRAVAGPKVRAECPAWKSCLFGSFADTLGRATSRPCIIRYGSSSLSYCHTLIAHATKPSYTDPRFSQRYCYFYELELYAILALGVRHSWVTTSQRTTRESDFIAHLLDSALVRPGWNGRITTSLPTRVVIWWWSW